MSQQGFTLIELLLGVAIITILTGLSLPVYESFVRRNDLDATTQSIASAIRRAQAYSRGGDEDSAWGVEVESTKVTLFKGTSFSGRTIAFDEVIPLPASVAITGTPEWIFAKLSGMPNAAGSLTLTSTTNDSRTVTVNVEGMVNY